MGKSDRNLIEWIFDPTMFRTRFTRWCYDLRVGCWHKTVTVMSIPEGYNRKYGIRIKNNPNNLSV